MSQEHSPATLSRDEIERFRRGDILLSDEQANRFCDLAISALSEIRQTENAAPQASPSVAPADSGSVPAAGPAVAAPLAAAARTIRDAFTYDPGHSDLDDEQPIHISTTLGAWRELHRELYVYGGLVSRSEQSVPSHAPRSEYELCFISCNSMTCAKLGRCRKEETTPSTTPRSETPRTDAVALGVAKYSNDDVKLREALAHGRDLERELAEVREGLRYSDAENDELRQENGALSAASATRLLRWVPVTERNPIIDTAEEQSAVLVANANIGAVLGAGRFTLQAGNVYAGTDHDGEPVWQIFCPYDSAKDVNGGHITLGPLEVTHWLEGCPPAPRENNRADGGKQTNG